MLRVRQFTVDATGKVVPSSVDVVDATQPAFGEAAQNALLQTGFNPGNPSLTCTGPVCFAKCPLFSPGVSSSG